MIHSRTLATAMLAAFGALGARPATASPVHPVTDATVVSLSVVPATGRADVLVRFEGAVSYKHFTLSKPDKIVVDLNGATLGLPEGDAYDGVARGGITRIRYSQFTRTVVRVVLTLDSAHPYVVTNDKGSVRISVEGAAPEFSPWAIGRESGSAKRDVPSTEALPEPLPPKAESVEPKVEQQLPVEPPPATLVNLKPKTAKEFGSFVQQSQEPRITYTPENASMADVLAAFSAFTGRTILPSKNVSGTVTANIINQPWDVALRKLMNANGYDVVIDESGIIIVDTFDAIAQRQATIPLQTRTVRLNYSRAMAVKDMVSARLSRTCQTAVIGSAPGLGQPGAGQQAGTVTTGIQSLTCPQRGTVTADTISNAISITDVPSALPELEAYTRSLDLRQPQVNIKAKIILVDRSTLEGLGIRYDLGSRNQFFNDIVPRLDSLGKPIPGPGQILLGGNTISSIANASARVPGAALQLVYSTAIGNYDFTTFLEALQVNTLLDVQAEPSLSVLNNRTADLTAGTQVPIRVVDAQSAAGNTGNAPRALVSMQQVGIILTVTPQITSNRQIQMKVHVENSDVQFQSNDVGAVFPTQKVDNEILVADGETAVMGGLTQTSVSISKSGIPLLVDLPIVGRLFGVTNKQERKRDLLILITPHIIDPGQQPPEDR
ncbi:MAG TPA: AMIN domain-containing protein [Gemmatimonadaceae bacterium]